MSRIFVLLLMLTGLLTGGCRPKAPAPVSTSTDSPTSTPARVAVLLFEDNLDFAGADAPGAGQAVYRAQVAGLTEALRARAVAAETVVVPPDGVDELDLAGFGSAVVVDAFMIMPATRIALERFVQEGGVLVGVHEVGRYPGAWVDPWPMAELFGLRARLSSAGGAVAPEAPPGFYQKADIVDASSLLMLGLTNTVDWGPLARQVWPVEAAGASVVANFPRHLAFDATGAEPVEVAEPLPAVTERRAGQGRAIYISVLPTGRQFAGWEQAPDAVTLVANAAKLARAGAPAAVRPVQLTLAVNQAGYAPGWPRTLVVRARGGATGEPLRGSYVVQTDKGDEVLRGELQAWPTELWHSRFARVDLAGVREPGSYRVTVNVLDAHAEIPLRIRAPGELSNELRQTVEAYLETIRCGEVCHADAPVTGGAHAAVDDSTVRLDDMLSLVWALTSAVEAYPEDQRLRFELERAVMWCWRVRGEDGRPASAVRPVGEAVPGQAAAEDRRPRELERTATTAQVARYAAVMARAVKPVRDLISLNLGQEITVAAERAYRLIREEALVSTADIGNRVWAAVEVYRVSYQADYLEDAKREAARLYARQLERDHIPGTAVYGDFFADGERASLSPLQFDRLRNQGVYHGLLELYRVLPAGPGKDDLRSVLDRFTQGFLINGAALSPYGQFAAALEPVGAPRPRPGNRGGFEPPERFQVRWFSYRGSPAGECGRNADQLALTAMALEWARETGQADLERTALQQLNWLLGANPLSLNQLAAERAVPNGITGRADHPVWSEGSTGQGAVAPNAALLAVLAALPDDQR